MNFFQRTCNFGRVPKQNIVKKFRAEEAEIGNLLRCTTSHKIRPPYPAGKKFVWNRGECLTTMTVWLQKASWTAWQKFNHCIWRWSFG